MAGSSDSGGEINTNLDTQFVKVAKGVGKELDLKDAEEKLAESQAPLSKALDSLHPTHLPDLLGPAGQPIRGPKRVK